MSVNLEKDNPVSNTRLQAIDVLRGAVMVLMAIDHVRVYSGLPAGGQTPGIFFTRWVTHFCVPAFVFFAGTGAFLYGNKIKDKSLLSRYLITRGILLIFLELTVIRFFWTFNFSYGEFTLAGVIWMLGCCMLLLAALSRLKPLVVGITGLAIIFFQYFFSLLPAVLPSAMRTSFGYVWEFVYPSGLDSLPGITILYVLVPWTGVMAAGYGFGMILLGEPGKMRKLCLRIGIMATILFIIAGSFFILSKPVQPGAPAFIFRLLNQTKYPASSLYLLMTLGPLIAVLPYAGRARGWLTRALSIFGRVPLFYYLLHILLIHLSALVVNLIKEGNVHSGWYVHAPFSYVPPEYQWSLSVLYLVFAIDVLLLYFACRWYAGYKSAHPEKKWLKYF
jgi:uncharacterized membrane protein